MDQTNILRMIGAMAMAAAFWVEQAAMAGTPSPAAAVSIGQADGRTLVARGREFPPPANDDFAGAAAISGATGSIDGTTLGATRESADLIPDHWNDDFYSSTVWYQWTAPADGTYAFSAADADGEGNRSAAVGVTTGYAAEEWGWNDADVNLGRILVGAAAGATYRIEVGSGSGEEIDFTLSWKKLHPPANDDFAEAVAISGTTGSIDGSTLDGTRELADLIPDHWNDDFCNSTVWYRWTAPADGTYAFSVADAGGGSAEVGVTTGYDEEEGAWSWSGAQVNWGRIVVEATAGAAYWLEVGSHFDEESAFTLSWKKLYPPGNDDFAGATAISGATGSIKGTTIDSTMESADLVSDWYGPSYGFTVWHRWTAPSDGTYAFSVTDADEERGWSAAVGVTTGYDGEEGTWSGAQVNWGRIAVTAAAGATYWIEVGSYSGEEFDFTLSWKKLHPPVNDNFADATAISGVTGSIGGTTVDSTREAADLIPDWYGSSYGSTVWYQWTAPAHGTYAFSAMDADEERDRSAAVGITTGHDGLEGAWSGAQVNWWRMVVEAAAGATYWIEVGSHSGEEFDFTLSWKSVTSPANDHFADAIEIEGISGGTGGSNLGASVEDGEPLPRETGGGGTFDTTASVWWRWKAPENGFFTVSTEGSDFDTVLGVYTGTSVDGLSTVAAHGGADGTSFATFGARAGTIYYFAVGGYKSNVGDIVLSWNRAAETGDDVVDAGDGKTVTVPGAWLAANTTRSATDLAANGRLLVWQCYVLGLDPEGPEDFRIVSFPMKADGTPDWEHTGVQPDPATWNVPAALQWKGSVTLDGPWNDVPGDNDAACRFFAAEFVLP